MSERARGIPVDQLVDPHESESYIQSLHENEVKTFFACYLTHRGRHKPLPSAFHPSLIDRGL